MRKLILFIFISGILSAYSQGPFKVLIFTKTSGFQHASIPDGIAAITTLGAQNNFMADQTDDAAAFTAANLSQYSAVIFLNTTGDVLNSNQETAFEQYIQAGGGFVGIHSASDTEYNWPWYGNLIGRYFENHPAVQSATLNVEDPNHPSTNSLINSWIHTDEWYNFATPFPAHLNVLLTVDENTYSGGTMGMFHPISWYHLFDGGRSFYTALGHTSATYSDSLFLHHLSGAILWAAGVTTSINENILINKLEIYPSPANDLINFNISPFEKPLNVELYNVRGEMVLREELVSKNSININWLENGVYIIKIYNKEKIYTYQKFIISR
jgi:cytochrome c